MKRSIIGSSYKQVIIDKFENSTFKVYFKLYLDLRKLPRSITKVEETIEEIIVKETYSNANVFGDLEIDLTSINIKRKNS